MGIIEPDRDLLVETNITQPDLIWFNALEAPFGRCGVFCEEARACNVRMP